MEQKFKVGDVVILKSGGLKMTVEKLPFTMKTNEYLGFVQCTWFLGEKLKRADFNQDMLKLFNE
jgi:uncharacterized protein YodC (DUF2158 family)